MGLWCFMTGQTPDVYRSLSALERDQFAAAATHAKEKGW